jgi:hypothetical protein
VDSFPRYDRALRREALDRMRTERRRARARMTPAQRMERALGIVAFAHATRALRPATTRHGDESTELWLAIKARLRAADAGR